MSSKFQSGRIPSNKIGIPSYLTYEYIDAKLKLGIGISGLSRNEGIVRHILNRHIKEIGIDISIYTIKVNEETKIKMSKSAKLVAKDRLSDNFKFSQLGTTQSKTTINKKSIALRDFYNSIKTGTGNMFLYVIEQDNLIKIGITNNFKERKQSIVRDYGGVKKLLLLKGDYSTILNIEKHLHNVMDSQNVIRSEGTGRTEWFNSSVFPYCLFEVKEKFIDKGVCECC